MTMVAPRISVLNGIQAAVQTGLTLAHSIHTRGYRQTLTFTALSIGLPVIAEYVVINKTKVLRHRTQPQAHGVPLTATLGWYNITYPSFALVEGLLVRNGLPSRSRHWFVPMGTAVLATNFDMLLDCVGLDQGLWEWNEDGPYATDIIGPNGNHGIPLENFWGWLGLTSIVAFVHLMLNRAQATDTARFEAISSPQATRTAAFLLLPYYFAGLGWAIQRRKFRYILYSLLVPATLLLALVRRPS